MKTIFLFIILGFIVLGFIASAIKGKYTNPKSDNTREITDNFFNWEDVSGKISKSELDSLEIWSDSWNDFYDKLYEDYLIKPYLKLHPRKKEIK